MYLFYLMFFMATFVSILLTIASKSYRNATTVFGGGGGGGGGKAPDMPTPQPVQYAAPAADSAATQAAVQSAQQQAAAAAGLSQTNYTKGLLGSQPNLLNTTLSGSPSTSNPNSPNSQATATNSTGQSLTGMAAQQQAIKSMLGS